MAINRHHRLPKSKGGSRTIPVLAWRHACHHTIASNHLCDAAIPCYSFALLHGLGWGGHLQIKRPGDYCFQTLNLEEGMLKSRDITIKMAIQSMFGANPNPRQVCTELEKVWLPPEGRIRYLQ